MRNNHNRRPDSVRDLNVDDYFGKPTILSTPETLDANPVIVSQSPRAETGHGDMVDATDTPQNG